MIRARFDARGRVVSWTSPRSACDAPRRGLREDGRISSARASRALRRTTHATGAAPAPRGPGRVPGGYARVGAPGVAGSGARVAEVGTGRARGAAAFKMLIRKDGNRRPPIGRPAEADFVVRARVQAEAEARERAELKRLVPPASADDSEQAEDDNCRRRRRGQVRGAVGRVRRRTIGEVVERRWRKRTKNRRRLGAQRGLRDSSEEGGRASRPSTD